MKPFNKLLSRCNTYLLILDYRRDFSSDSPASAVPDKAPVTPSTTAVNSSRESSSSSTAKLIEGNINSDDVTKLG